MMTLTRKGEKLMRAVRKAHGYSKRAEQILDYIFGTGWRTVRQENE